MYFTEQWVGAPSNFVEDLKWHVKNLIIGAPRNWSKNVIEWNLASDPNYYPHTDGGCGTCLGALTIILGGEGAPPIEMAWLVAAAGLRAEVPGVGVVGLRYG